MSSEGHDPSGSDQRGGVRQRGDLDDPLDQVEAAERAEGQGRGASEKVPDFSDAPPNRPWENEPLDAEVEPEA